MIIISKYHKSSAAPNANFFGDILQPQGSNPASNDLFGGGGGFGGFPATNGTNNIAAAKNDLR